MRGLALIGTAPLVVALRTTVRDRRARLWLVIVDAWARRTLAGPARPEPLRQRVWEMARVFDRTVERSRFDGTEVDVQRARAWCEALEADPAPRTPVGEPTVLWAAFSAWDDAAAEQRGRRERGGVPWDLYARACEAVAREVDAEELAAARAAEPDVVSIESARAAMALRERMDAVEARLWGRA